MSEPSHPVITFQVNLELSSSESVGPNTNLVNPHVLSPDRHQNDQDNALVENSNRQSTRSLYLPGLLVGENRAGNHGLGGTNLVHGSMFTVKGLKALYIKDTYTNGVTGDATSSPLYVYSTDPADSVHPEDL
jgi:hypothetical protein